MGRALSARFVADVFRVPKGNGVGIGWSPPRPSVVPDTLSGPGRDEGSHVNLYGRVLGVWFTEAFSGVIGREGEDEISDIKDQCIRSKQMIINSSDITFVTIFHSAICDYSSILSVIQDLKNWYHASQSGFAPLLLCPFLLLMLSFFNHHRIGRGRGSGLCHFPTFRTLVGLQHVNYPGNL